MEEEVRIRRWVNECSKWGYINTTEAKRSVRRNRKKGYGTKRIYKCPKCQWYHLTSLKKVFKVGSKKATKAGT